MNANELADYLDNSVEAMLYTEQPYLDQAAAMLRQQQAEIEALSKSLSGRGTPNDELANHKFIIQRLHDKIDDLEELVTNLRYKNDLLVNRLEVITGKKASEK